MRTIANFFIGLGRTAKWVFSMLIHGKKNW
jgi:hypothetical protein